MISLIISTRKNQSEQQEIEQHIRESIGTSHEVIFIENHKKYSLCEAYNIGFAKAQFPYLCFVHDDVNFMTPQWGKEAIEIMEQDASMGLLGVAGTKFKSSYPSAWGQSPYLGKYKRGRIIHEYENKRELLEYDGTNQPSNTEEVVVLDGVFLFAKRAIFSTCRFDEELLTHFHGYDIDFSLQVFFKGYKVCVTRNIEITHYSGGNYSAENTVANRKIAKKWRKNLPVATSDLALKKLSKHYQNARNWLYFLSKAMLRKLNL